MIGNIRKDINISTSKISIDDFFDPNTHTANLDDFITFLSLGIYTRDVIGYKVESTRYVSGGTYKMTYLIADLDHDSTNTGQTNCYDLITLYSYGRTPNRCWWENGTSYRNQVIIDAAQSIYTDTYCYYLSSQFKTHIMNIKYNYNGSWYTDNKVVMLSATELGLTNVPVEGVSYPMFDSTNSSRTIFNIQGWGNAFMIRTITNDSWCCEVKSDGSFYDGSTGGNASIGVIRVS